MIKLESNKVEVIRIIEEPRVCSCSNKHVPNPMKYIEISDGGSSVVICPTFLVNLVDLLEQYDLHTGPPPGKITKHYGKDVRDLAKRLWTAP